MKKGIIILLTLLVLIAIVVIVFNILNQENEILKDPGITGKSDTKTFKGTIHTINENYAIVVPNNDEIEILSSGDQVYVKLPSTLNLEIGEEIIVEYDGTIMESYPLQINEISINGIEF